MECCFHSSALNFNFMLVKHLIGVYMHEKRMDNKKSKSIFLSNLNRNHRPETPGPKLKALRLKACLKENELKDL